MSKAPGKLNVKSIASKFERQTLQETHKAPVFRSRAKTPSKDKPFYVYPKSIKSPSGTKAPDSENFYDNTEQTSSKLSEEPRQPEKTCSGEGSAAKQADAFSAFGESKVNQTYCWILPPQADEMVEEPTEGGSKKTKRDPTDTLPPTPDSTEGQLLPGLPIGQSVEDEEKSVRIDTHDSSHQAGLDCDVQCLPATLEVEGRAYMVTPLASDVHDKSSPDRPVRPLRVVPIIPNTQADTPTMLE